MTISLEGIKKVKQSRIGTENGKGGLLEGSNTLLDEVDEATRGSNDDGGAYMGSCERSNGKVNDEKGDVPR
jgi:hypothetical protein